MATMQRDQANLSFAAIIGATVTIAVITGLTIWADLQPEIKTWLRETLYHHWVGKGLIGIAVFLLSGIFATAGGPKTEDQVAHSGRALFWTGITASVVLTVFYFFEAFLK